MSNDQLTLIEELVLLELAACKSGAARTRSELRAGTLPQARAGIVPALARLAGLRLIEELPRAPRQRSARWRIRSPGRERLREILGGSATRQGRTSKQKAARTLAVRRFLGLAPRAAIALVEQSALPVYFLAARLGEEFQPGMTLDSLARRAAAAALGLSNDQPETLWRAIVQGALAGENALLINKDKSQGALRDDRQSLAALLFPAQIDRAADTAREGWFGPRKLFIHRAWEAWKAVSGETVDLSDFKTRLLASLRAGDLSLARADFTPGMDGADLKQAETRYGDEVFHFINFAYDKHP